MPMIEIRDEPNLHLANLLEQVAGTDELDWSIIEMWAVARDEETDVMALEKEAAQSPSGLAMSGDELRDLAGRLAQVIDGIFAGFRGTPPARSDADLRDAAEVVIEAIDSTLWRIYADDPAIIDQLKRLYDDARDVVPEVAIPPVHEQS